MERLHPGVYIEEVPSGVRPIEGVSTSNAAFIGKAQMGPLNKAVLITNLQQFTTKYGTFIQDSYLAHSVLQFFNNGGKKAYIVRIAGTGARAAAIAIKDRKTPSAKTLTVKAANEGVWGNKIDIAIRNGTEDPDNEFAILVFRDRGADIPPLPPLLLETHDNLSMNKDAKNYVGKIIKGNSSYVIAEVDSTNIENAATNNEVVGTSRSGQLPVGNAADLLNFTGTTPGTPTPGTDGPPPTAGTFRSGDSPAVTLPADRRKIVVNINGDGGQEIIIPLDAGTGPEIASAIQTAVRALTANLPTNQAAYDNFTCTYDTSGANPFYLLTSGTTGANSSVDVTDSTDTSISLGAGQHQFVIHVNDDGPHVVTLTGPLADGAAIATAILTAVQSTTPKRSANANAFSNFECAYQNEAASGNPSLLLTSGERGVSSSVQVTNAPGSRNVANTLSLGLTNRGTEIVGAAVLRPANSGEPTEYHLGDAVVIGNIDSVVPGNDGATPGDAEYEASLTVGLSPLDVIQDVNIICIPGIGTSTVVSQGANYCTQRMDCFFIGDVNQTDDTVPEAQDFLNSLTVKSSYGAVYYPWLKMTDPTGKSPEPIAVPPSGFVAGMYARIDTKRGIFKAPAGTEANIGGAAGLVTETTDVEQDFLNPIGINVIRSFPASGIVIWGTRTLATRSDPEYRYIPVRRTAIFLEQSIYNGIQWAVFEPNDEGLWASLRLNITAFMLLQFRAGAFQGSSPGDAFFVKVDSETTTQADIDAGVVNILVGFAPLKPAEFVVLKLTQKVNQSAG